jgi:subtilisin
MMSKNNLSASLGDLLKLALKRGDDKLETTRVLITFKEGAGEAGLQWLRSLPLNVADSRDFPNQVINLENLDTAIDAVFLAEIGVALVGAQAAEKNGLTPQTPPPNASVEDIGPEHLQFAMGRSVETAAPTDNQGPGLSDYLKHLHLTAKGSSIDARAVDKYLKKRQVAGAVLPPTSALLQCNVPSSTRSGKGIRVAALDTGFEFAHPDFEGRSFTRGSFIGSAELDRNGHGTHTTGTACGPKMPVMAKAINRYGIAYESDIYIGKVLDDSGACVQGPILAGMNWAISNSCAVILVAIGAVLPEQPSYTAAGRAALSKGCLIIAAAGNIGPKTGAPANSTTILSIALLPDPMVTNPPSDKIDLAAPGVGIYSSWKSPCWYNTIQWGTSMAAAHVAGCAALWAETSPALRGQNLWNQLRQSAKKLDLPGVNLGAGLVQAPQ